eukprot:1146959-Prymnesium_polylepis.1
MSRARRHTQCEIACGHGESGLLSAGWCVGGVGATPTANASKRRDVPVSSIHVCLHTVDFSRAWPQVDEELFVLGKRAGCVCVGRVHGARGPGRARGTHTGRAWA